MSIILAYAISVFLNLGVISASDVNQNINNLSVIQRDGKTIVVDSASGHEIVVSV